MSPVSRPLPLALASDRDGFIQALADHRQGLRTFLAGFSSTRAQIDVVERELWATWITRPKATNAIGIRAGLQLLGAAALGRHLDASAATALAIQDPLGYLLAQTGREALQRGVDPHDIASRVQAGIAGLDQERRDLILGRYKDGLGNQDLATQRGWDRAQVDAVLKVARAALDQIQPPSSDGAALGQESLLTALTEDFLAGGIDPDSQRLLAQRVRDDLPFAASLERQVRIDLLLGECLGGLPMEALTAFADEILATTAGSQPRTPAADSPRSATVDSRRSAKISSQRLRRRMPSPLLGATLAGGVVLAVILAVSIKPPSGSGRHDWAQAPRAQEAPTAIRVDAPSPAPPPSGTPLVAQPPSPLARQQVQEVAQQAPSPAPPVVSAVVAPPAALPADASPPPAPVITPPPSDVAAQVPQVEPLVVPGGGPEVAAAVGRPFLKGIHLGGEAVTIAGERWQSQKQAEADGLTLTNARKVAASLPMVPPPSDADTRAMLGSGISTAHSEPLGMTLKLPDGGYELTFWTAETQRAHARVFDLTCGGVVVSGPGDLPLRGWAKCGPIAVEVRNQKLDIVAKALRGTPVLMGIAISRTTAAKSYMADFSAGVAKDWTPLGGAWSCADGRYLHTSAEGLDISVYDPQTWKDLAFKVSMMPRYDNVCGLVFGFKDAQNYDALTLNGQGTAVLARLVNGVRTIAGQVANTGASKWKTSAVTVTRVGRKVTATISGVAVFSDSDLGEPAEGKVGLLTDFNPVDFSGISIGLPPAKK